MSSNNNSKNVVDEAARARKLLAKNAPQKLSGIVKTSVTLQQGAVQNLGEHAVVALVTANNSHQYVISHPIGVTGLDEEAWVINRIDYIPSMLLRRENPGLGALNQERAQSRTLLAVNHGLLVKQEESGKVAFFYPNRVDKSRNGLLEEARHLQKIRKSELEFQKSQSGSAEEKSRIGTDLSKAGDLIEFLDETTREAETKLRQFWSSAQVKADVENQCPETYRTLTGPYGDQEQHEIKGSKGKTLDAVMNQISKRIAEIMFNEEAGGTPLEEPPMPAVAKPPDNQAVAADSLVKAIEPKPNEEEVLPGKPEQPAPPTPPEKGKVGSPPPNQKKGGGASDGKKGKS